MSAGCSREPTVRKLKRDLYLMTERLNALDSFARKAGAILEDAFINGESELDKIVGEYRALFPSDQSMEF